ncbi:Uncharacterised protein [Legionella wadsworthii]|uniref:Transmembrane protein n=1 Tax=Legionella wadsworthii TaxID=28088 RepID=A0A378LSK8_9GAMM|nr:hypothetical protein [Legionella wadsworthii]STY29968.1 Uncharacterised protein [Legionella wadsworthii]
MEALKQLEALITAKISVIKTVCSLIRLEARLAGLSVLPLLVNVCLLFVVLLTISFTVTSLIGCLVYIMSGYFVVSASNRFLISIVVVLLLNVGFLIGLIKYLSFNIKNMSFQKTRNYFSQTRVQHEKLEEADNSAN